MTQKEHQSNWKKYFFEKIILLITSFILTTFFVIKAITNGNAHHNKLFFEK